MIKARKFRRRADDDDDVDTEDGDKALLKAAEKGKEEKSGKEKGKDKSVPKSSGPILLSFAEDDEYAGKTAAATVKSGSRREKSTGKPASKSGEVSLLSFEALADGKVLNGVKSKKRAGFGADKGSGLPRLGLGRDKSVSSSSVPSNVQPQAGEYTKEKLAELHRNTIRLGGPGPLPPADKKPSEPVVVLKGLVKPVAVTNGNTAEGNDKTIALAEPNIFNSTRERDDRRDQDDAESRLGLMGIGAGAESGGITHIPDAAAIAAAKAKRERLRQAQAAPDYISLAPGDGADFRSNLRESALVREDDDDVEREEDESSADEAEVQGRLAFLGEKTAHLGHSKRTGVFESFEDRVAEGMPLQEQKDEDEEDEERRWEEEQLRKGIGKRVEEAPNFSAQVQVASGFGVPAAAHSAAMAAVGPGWGLARGLEGLSVAQQAEAAMRSLQESVLRMRESHAKTESDLYRTKENLSISVQSVSSLENSLAAAGNKYVYMQELRDYISVLCDFLQDKAPLIEELEEHMQRLHEERANAVTERRVGDNADEMAEVEVAVGAAKAVLSKGAGTATAAAAAAATLSAPDSLNLAPHLDEFGRDVNLQKRMESKRRAQARARRAAAAAARRATSMPLSANGDSGGTQRVEGESSSDESDSEAAAYKSRRKEVIETAGRIFGDAIEEFAQIQKVKEKLENWKWQYPSAYRDAYVSLSAPALFAPYVRLELLQWDPLYSDAGFSNMQWYRQLYEYGLPANGKEFNADDSDGDLVPKLVEKVALPILHHEIAHCWDRLSSQGTRRAVAAVLDILVYVPASSEALQELLSVARVRIANAVATIDVPTWSLQVLNAVPQAARLVAHKFGTSVRLLCNIGMWMDVLALPVLEKLALDELLSGKILPHLRTLMTTPHDAITRTERVMAALAGVWVGSNRELSPKLAPFVEYVTALTRAVEKKRDGGGSSEDSMVLARRVKRILVELNEYDRARQLAKHFQLKEAL